MFVAIPQEPVTLSIETPAGPRTRNFYLEQQTLRKAGMLIRQVDGSLANEAADQTQDLVERNAEAVERILIEVMLPADGGPQLTLEQAKQIRQDQRNLILAKQLELNRADAHAQATVRQSGDEEDSEEVATSDEAGNSWNEIIATLVSVGHDYEAICQSWRPSPTLYSYRLIQRDRWREAELHRILAGCQPQEEPDFGLDNARKSQLMKAHEEFKKRVGPLEELGPLSMPDASKVKRLL